MEPGVCIAMRCHVSTDKCLNPQMIYSLIPYLFNAICALMAEIVFGLSLTQYYCDNCRGLIIGEANWGKI